MQRGNSAKNKKPLELLQPKGQKNAASLWKNSGAQRSLHFSLRDQPLDMSPVADITPVTRG